MTRNDRFANKVVIVTGAAQGIGRGVALAVCAEGGTVLAVDRSPASGLPHLQVWSTSGM